MRRDIFSHEHEMFREQVRRFVEREIEPRVAQWNRDGISDRESWRKMGAAGYLGANAPAEYGGAGADAGGRRRAVTPAPRAAPAVGVGGRGRRVWGCGSSPPVASGGGVPEGAGAGPLRGGGGGPPPVAGARPGPPHPPGPARARAPAPGGRLIARSPFRPPERGWPRLDRAAAS